MSVKSFKFLILNVNVPPELIPMVKDLKNDDVENSKNKYSIKDHDDI